MIRDSPFELQMTRACRRGGNDAGNPAGECNSLVFRASIHSVEILQRFDNFIGRGAASVVSNPRGRLFSTELPLPLGNFAAWSESVVESVDEGILKARESVLYNF